MQFHLREYVDQDDINHFRRWLSSLPLKVKARIQVRLLRAEQGNLGDWKSIENGLFEFRFHFESGLRVYFGRDGKNIILLLAGGDKSSQRKDILKAKKLWDEYKKGDSHGS